jgi:hypothetical protein
MSLERVTAPAFFFLFPSLATGLTFVPTMEAAARSDPGMAPCGTPRVKASP